MSLIRWTSHLRFRVSERVRKRRLGKQGASKKIKTTSTFKEKQRNNCLQRGEEMSAISSQGARCARQLADDSEKSKKKHSYDGASEK